MPGNRDAACSRHPARGFAVEQVQDRGRKVPHTAAFPQLKKASAFRRSGDPTEVGDPAVDGQPYGIGNQGTVQGCAWLSADQKRDLYGWKLLK